MNAVLNQFKNLQKDKLLICKKELLYMQNLVSFYQGNKSDFYTNKFKEIYKNINVLLEKHIPELLNKINKNAENYNGEPYYYYLVYHELTEYRIEELIEEIKLLSMKITQNSEEYFDQYIPKALLGRRYNNKVITHFFEDYFTTIVQKYNVKSENMPIFVWDFSNNYTVYTIKEENRHSIVKNAFWYYEIPRLIPNLLHEIGHLLEVTDDFNTFKKNVSSLEDEDLTEEIYGDFIALQELGYSYFLSLFYTISHNDLSRVFYNAAYNTVTIPYFSNNIFQKISIDRLSKNYIRIIALMNFLLNKQDITEEDNSFQEHVKEIKKFVSNYIMINSKHDDNQLAKLYKEHYPEHYEDYKDFCSNINEKADIILKNITHIPNSNPKQSKCKISNNTNNNIDYETIFNRKWETRLKEDTKWVHKNDLRRDILSCVLPKTKEKDFFAYELVLYKERVDSNNTDSDKKVQNPFIESNFFRSDKLFGLFNSLELIKKVESIDYKTIDSYIELFEETTHNSYCIKYPLTHIETINEGTTGKLPFSLVLQIQLKDMKQETIKNVYDILISDEFKTACCSQKYTIYKSLGPNDYVVVIESLSLRTIFELKEKLSNKADIRRTSTIIYRNENHYNDDCNTNTQILLQSKLRIKSNITDIKKTLTTLESSIDKILYTTGATDLTIIWKGEVSSISFYDKIYPNLKNSLKGKVSDIQTFIDYVYPRKEKNTNA